MKMTKQPKIIKGLKYKLKLGLTTRQKIATKVGKKSYTTVSNWLTSGKVPTNLVTKLTKIAGV